MKTRLIATAAAIALALATPALAGGDSHHGNENAWHGGSYRRGGGGWRWHNGGWVWGAPLAAAAALGVLGGVLASPYYYAPPYTYPYRPYYPPAYPDQRQCPNGYGGWFWC